ncbi:Hypothetical predicted protein [Lynx pardinus]|uniref:Uncharacterized protein n=1 Tax=Lynx pardinus TaxID=191816 RepID=A0A485NSS0_LYNPA|nr:Hypothetical predicted protein [Lynx pardinus]
MEKKLRDHELWELMIQLKNKMAPMKEIEKFSSQEMAKLRIGNIGLLMADARVGLRGF